MIDLKADKEYVKETIELLAIATEMETIIVDSDSLVIADSTYEDWKKFDFRENPEYLSHHSIVRQAIHNNRKYILRDAKAENTACKRCINAATCNINSIIALPIHDDDDVIGGIGFYSYDDLHSSILNEKSDAFMDFINKICEMLVLKLKEKDEKHALKVASEQQRLLISSLDDAVIGIDTNNIVTIVNGKFCKMFGVRRTDICTIEDVTAAFKNPKLKDFIDECSIDKSQEKAAFTVGGEEIIVVYKPISPDEVYSGALIYFRKGSDIYKDLKAIKDNYYNITFEDICGSSKHFKALKKRAERFAKGPSNILIEGESGTGKDMFARAIHNASLVSNGPFVAVNCAAIPENLIESELFGYKEGAFTGAAKGGRVGRFEQANKGTLFLDEIGELPLHMQSKLLRAIQEKQIQPLGSNEYKPIDIRIVAATNRNMKEMVDDGEFREDLYYRLNVIPLYIPALRERKEDIPVLLDTFLEKFNGVLDKDIIGFDPEAESMLINYDWPGNIRELQNIVEYSVNDCDGKYITPDNLPNRSFVGAYNINNISLMPLKDIENYYIKEALKLYGNTSEGKILAAKALGISRATLYRKIAELES